MRALVTGAGGFVGGHLVRHLEAAVTTSSSSSAPSTASTSPMPEITEAVIAAKPTAVYHLAGAADVGGSWATPHRDLPGQRRGHAQRARGGREAGRGAGAGRDAAPTSTAASPRTSCPSPRTSRCGRCSPYAASKVAADALAQQAWLGHRLPVIRVRAFNHLGPGQSDRFVAPSLAARIARNERDGGDEVPIGNLRRGATSPTSATSCGPTGCSSSTARRARSTTCAAAGGRRAGDRRPAARRWPGGRCAW